MSQSYTTVPAPFQHVDEAETIAAQKTTTHDPQSKSSPIVGGARYHAVGECDETTPDSPGDKEGLPEQKHAGAVGYGPNFANNRATLGDKITGIKEQVVGKVTNNPELMQKGHDRKTGELKRKQQEEHGIDPFPTDETQEPTLPPRTTTRTSTRTDIDGYATGDTKSSGLDRGKSTNNDIDL